MSRDAKRLEIAGLGMPVRTLRVVGLVGAAASIVGALLCLRAMRRRLPRESARIALRHGKRILRVDATRHQAQLVVVDVASFESLARLADQEGKLILHQQTGDQDTYLFQSDRAVYQYTAPHPLPPPALEDMA